MPKGIYPRGKRVRRPPRFITRPEAMALQQEHKRRNAIVTWSVTKDQECGYVAQPTVAGRTYHCRLQAAELDRLRKQLPPGLTFYPGDDETLEVWI